MDPNTTMMIEALLHGGGQADEHIASSAYKHGDKIYSGITHGDALTEMLDALKGKEKYPLSNWKSENEGFLTNRGRFVSREEAHNIADRSGQGDRYRQAGGYGISGLTAEDLLPRDTVIHEIVPGQTKFLPPNPDKAQSWGVPGTKLTDFW